MQTSYMGYCLPCLETKKKKKNAIVHQNNNGSVIVPSQTWLFKKTPPNEWAKVEKWESPLV